MRVILLAGLALLGLASQHGNAIAAELSVTARVSAVFQAEPPAVPANPPVQGSSGLPPRVPPPRTLHAYWPVFGGFAVTWVGIIAYALTFHARLRRIGDEIAHFDAQR